jgi:hypothetical protein
MARARATTRIDRIARLVESSRERIRMMDRIQADLDLTFADEAGRIRSLEELRGEQWERWIGDLRALRDAASALLAQEEKIGRWLGPEDFDRWLRTGGVPGPGSSKTEHKTAFVPGVRRPKKKTKKKTKKKKPGRTGDFAGVPVYDSKWTRIRGGLYVRLFGDRTVVEVESNRDRGVSPASGWSVTWSTGTAEDSNPEHPSMRAAMDSAEAQDWRSIEAGGGPWGFGA